MIQNVITETDFKAVSVIYLPLPVKNNVRISQDNLHLIILNPKPQDQAQKTVILKLQLVYLKASLRKFHITY